MGGRIYVTFCLAVLFGALLACSAGAQGYRYVGQLGSNMECEFGSPEAVAIDASGNIYIADIVSDCIHKISPSGVFIAKWGGTGAGNGQFNNPFGVAVDASGNVYVADTNNCRIQKFSPSGAFLSKWGGSGAGDGQFNQPQAIAIDASDNIYIADTLNSRIQIFDASGTLIGKWGTYGAGSGSSEILKESL